METVETTPVQDGSLDSAADAFAGLLSQVEKKEKAESKPEPTKGAADPESQQAQPEPQEEIEAAKPEDAAETESQPIQPKTVKAKDLATGDEVEVTEEEQEKGYLRVQDYTKKTQTLAQQRKEWEEKEVAAVRQERAQIQQMLEQLKPVLRPTEPDWAKLKAELAPEQYAERLEAWRVQSEHLSSIEKTQAQIKERQDAEAARGFEQYVKDEQDKLAIELPAFREPEKALALKKELSAFAMTRGFTEDDLSRVTDHRLVLLLHDAMQGAKTKAKAPEVKNKIERAMSPTPPGPSKSTTPKANRYNEAAQRLRSKGDLGSAADAIDALIEKVGG